MDPAEMEKKWQELQERLGYIECGPGWASIIEECDRRLRELDSGYAVDQIKEKFGGLRYYATSSSPDVDVKAWEAAIEDARNQSLETCENCGNAGKLSRFGYWCRTVCPECFKEFSGGHFNAIYDVRASA